MPAGYAVFGTYEGEITMCGLQVMQSSLQKRIILDSKISKYALQSFSKHYYMAF